MPNTNPPTSNMKEFQRKLDLAKNRMYCNYAFYFGATAALLPACKSSVSVDPGSLKLV